MKRFYQRNGANPRFCFWCGDFRCISLWMSHITFYMSHAMMNIFPSQPKNFSASHDCRNSDMDPMSEAFLQMASIFNQLELSMIKARIRSGMANAREKGRQIGRKPITKEDLPPTFIKYYPSYMKSKTIDSQIQKMYGENPFHNAHIDEFREMAATMINEALKNYSE